MAVNSIVQRVFTESLLQQADLQQATIRAEFELGSTAGEQPTLKEMSELKSFLDGAKSAIDADQLTKESTAVGIFDFDKAMDGAIRRGEELYRLSYRTAKALIVVCIVGLIGIFYAAVWRDANVLAVLSGIGLDGVVGLLAWGSIAKAQEAARVPNKRDALRLKYSALVEECRAHSDGTPQGNLKALQCISQLADQLIKDLE